MYSRLKCILFLVLFLTSFKVVLASTIQELKTPVTVTIAPVEYSEAEAIFVLELLIPENWKVYSNNNGDTGLPFSIGIKESKNIKSYEIIWPEHKVVEEFVGNKIIKTNIYTGRIQIPIIVKSYNDKEDIELDAKITFGACNKTCMKQIKELKVSIKDGFANQKTYEGIKYLLKNHINKLWLMLIFGVLGGFILNLMPCVLPVLSIKIMNIISYSNLTKGAIRLNLLGTAAGIILSFLALAIITLVLKNSGEMIGWGFHFQQPQFIMFMITVVSIFSLSLLDKIQINLPIKLADKISSITSKGCGIYSSFISGIFATALATPCTAPFLTTSVAFALTQGGVLIILIYLAVGFGMALPYMIIMLFPKAISSLPRPGQWMNKLKKLFGILLLLTACWLYYVLLSEVFLRTVLIFTGSLILLRFILSEYFYDVTFWLRSMLIVLAFSSTLLLPYFMTSTIDLEKKVTDKFWLDFEETTLINNINKGKIVFLDITADWCITCKINKFFVLDNQKLLQILNQNGVILIRADYTNFDKRIYKFLEKKKHLAVPFNAVYSTRIQEGFVLPSLLTYAGVIDAIQKAE